MGDSNPSLSTKGLIVCRAGDGGFHSEERQGGSFDSQHMASRGGTMMRGRRQLVGVLGCIWGLDEGSQRVTWIKKKVGVSKSPPNQQSESITQAIHHRCSFVVSITVAS